MCPELRKQFVGKSSALLPWLEDAQITDILINGTGVSYVERNGDLEQQPRVFSDPQTLFDLIERMLIPLGKRIDAAHPYADGRLADGSRFHVILPPLAPEGPLISIRKKRRGEACPLGSFAGPEVVNCLIDAVRDKRNMLICGGTGTGKTTLLCRLLDRVPEQERVIIIEECLEIDAAHAHLVHLEARAPTPDGAGGVSLRTLIRNALRMRPDRLILGECRGAEAFDLVQVMNTGHSGSFCTIHANSCRDGLRRLEGMVLMSGIDVGVRVVREWIASCIDMVVYLEKRGPIRQVLEIICINGLEGEVYRMVPRFGYGSGNSRQQRGIDTAHGLQLTP